MKIAEGGDHHGEEAGTDNGEQAKVGFGGGAKLLNREREARVEDLNHGWKRGEKK